MPGRQERSAPETFSFELKDRYGNVTPIVTAIAGGNGSQTVTGAASGHIDIPLGNCNHTVALSGNENVVTLGSGCDVVHGGQDGAIYLTGAAGLVIHGTDEMVFAGKDDATINDFSKGPRLDIGPTSRHDVLMGFCL